MEKTIVSSVNQPEFSEVRKSLLDLSDGADFAIQAEMRVGGAGRIGPLRSRAQKSGLRNKDKAEEQTQV